MSDELRQLEQKRSELSRELQKADQQIVKMRIQFDKIDCPLICPKCKLPDSHWQVYTTYNPFAKKAWEYRAMKLRCKHCGYELVESIETEHGN